MELCIPQTWIPSLSWGCGESHLQLFAQPLEARGSPHVPLPEITHYTVPLVGDRSTFWACTFSHFWELKVSIQCKIAQVLCPDTSRMPSGNPSLITFCTRFSSIPQEILSPLSLLEATFIFPFRRAISWLASKWVHFETPVKFLNSILRFRQCCWIKILFITLTKWCYKISPSKKQQAKGNGGHAFSNIKTEHFCPHILLKIKRVRNFLKKIMKVFYVDEMKY